MITINNIKIYLAAGLVCCAIGAATTACSDFDDYNEPRTDAIASANKTLWENIQQNGQLSDFAQLVQKAGFADELNQTHCYTVWAPLNGTYDVAALQRLDNDALLRQFVKNHIADYSHQATGALNERVLMLNEKSYNFVGMASYVFDGKAVAQSNLPNSNGLLHTLNGALEFYPNLYEYVTDSLLAYGKSIDQLRRYFKRYELTYLDEDASVPGPIVDGMQTWVDSVMVTRNTLWNQLNTRMMNEDSTYTVLLPNDVAWEKAYDRIKSYYNYAATTKAQTFTSGNIDTKPAEISIDQTYWQDSITSLQLVSNLFYSNNDAYNTWLKGTPTAYGSDTLRSTTYTKLSNPQAILGQARHKVELSNGTAHVVDSLAMYPWETYAPELSISAGSRSNIARVVTGSYQTFNVKGYDIDDYSYIHVTPAGGYARPELDLFLSGVLSTEYDFYCVFVPPYDAYTEENLLPNRVIFTLSYCDETGALKEYTFLDESEENISTFQERFNLADNNSNRTTIRAFSNDPERLDTVWLGRFTFPVCYAGLGNDYRPNIKITSPFSVFNKNLMSAFTRDLRIASIIMKPRELVEFEESKK
jgi:uncharacterized surface protein with fasciclin (FAS1) repeats